jgi:aminoglycoside/choline kinase family phosphotransferase
VRVPDLYGYWDSEGILLLEDLGDQALWDRVQGLEATEIIAWYRKAIDELLTLQLRDSARRAITASRFSSVSTFVSICGNSTTFCNMA